jgi:hypothetical protein
VIIVKDKLLLIISIDDGNHNLKLSFITFQSGLKSSNFIFIPSFQLNNINNPIKQEIICKIIDTTPAQTAHQAGKGQYQATKIGSKMKFKIKPKIAI